MTQRYRNHDAEAVIESPEYRAHVHAMTGEDLNSKSEIAQELAVRDKRIAELEGVIKVEPSSYGEVCAIDEDECYPPIWPSVVGIAATIILFIGLVWLLNQSYTYGHEQGQREAAIEYGTEIGLLEDQARGIE